MQSVILSAVKDLNAYMCREILDFGPFGRRPLVRFAQYDMLYMTDT